MSPDALDYGIVGLALIFAYKVMEVVKQIYLARKVDGLTAANATIPTMTPLACQVDPTHFSRIKEIHAYTERVGQAIDRGEFFCAWKDRDEVRDMLESLRTLTGEVRLLRAEMVKTRNGGNR